MYHFIVSKAFPRKYLVIPSQSPTPPPKHVHYQVGLFYFAPVQTVRGWSQSCFILHQFRLSGAGLSHVLFCTSSDCQGLVSVMFYFAPVQTVRGWSQSCFILHQFRLSGAGLSCFILYQLRLSGAGLSHELISFNVKGKKQQRGKLKLKASRFFFSVDKIILVSIL